MLSVTDFLAAISLGHRPHVAITVVSAVPLLVCQGLPQGFAFLFFWLTGAPLVIPIGRYALHQPAGVQQDGTGMPAAGSSEQQQVQQNQQQGQQQQQPAPAVAGAGTSDQQQQRQQEQRQGQGQRQAASGDDDVIILDSGSESESDSDVVITGVTQRKRPRQVMMQSTQVQQQYRPRINPQITSRVAGPTMPTWEQPHVAARQRSPSPEPAIKCLICLEGIKTDNMATTPCGYVAG